jgi:large subunit ribosomal protein L10
MSREKKEARVKQLEEIFSGSTSIIFTDYRGMRVADMNSLRRKLRERGIHFQVIKNTLAQIAGERVGKRELDALLQGPTAIAYGFGEISEPAKALAEYISATKPPLSIKGGILGERRLRPEEVSVLVTLPSRDILLAKLVGGIKAPLYSLHSVLSANLRKFMYLLQARMQQLEGGEGK